MNNPVAMKHPNLQKVLGTVIVDTSETEERQMWTTLIENTNIKVVAETESEIHTGPNNVGNQT